MLLLHSCSGKIQGLKVRNVLLFHERMVNKHHALMDERGRDTVSQNTFSFLSVPWIIPFQREMRSRLPASTSYNLPQKMIPPFKARLEANLKSPLDSANQEEVNGHVMFSTESLQKKMKKETKQKNGHRGNCFRSTPRKKDNFLPYQLLFENICQLCHHTPLHLGQVIY